MLSISLGFTTETLAQPIENKTYEFPLSVPQEGDRYIPPVVSARWGNGIVQAVELSPSVYFIERPVTLGFFGWEDTSFNCRDAEPQDPPSAFEILFHCRATTLKLENEGKRWVVQHREALDAWHRANRHMTDRLTDRKRRSPYTLDPELIQRLKSLIDDVKQRSWNRQRIDDEIRPLRYDDVLQTVRMHRESGIKMTGIIPDLVDVKRLDDALSITKFAQNTLIDLMEERDIKLNQNYTVHGINLHRLEQDEAYIDNLIAQQESYDRTRNAF